MPGKVDVFNLGDQGVDLVNPATHAADGSLVSAQNAIVNTKDAAHGLSKRPGLRLLSMAGAGGGIIHALTAVPFWDADVVTYEDPGAPPTPDAPYEPGAPFDPGAPLVSTHRAHVYLAADFTVATATDTLIPFTAEDYDVGGLHDNAVNNSRITLVESGWYLIVAQASWYQNSTGRRSLKLFVDGQQEAIGELTSGSDAGVGVSHQVATFGYLTAGQYIECTVKQSSGGNLDMIGANRVFTSLKVLKLPFVAT